MITIVNLGIIHCKKILKLISSFFWKANWYFSAQYGPWELVWRFYQGSVATRIPLTKDQSSPLVGKVVLFDRVHSFGRDPHVSVRKEGDTHLASQISQINPGNQWGDRCHSQIALTSKGLTFKGLLAEALSNESHNVYNLLLKFQNI